MLLAAWNFGCIPLGYGLVRVAFLGKNDMQWSSTALKRLVYDAKCGQRCAQVFRTSCAGRLKEPNPRDWGVIVFAHRISVDS